MGSPNYVTSEGGVVVGRSKNLPFGERFASEGLQSFERFAGHEDDGGVPIYMQARAQLPAYGVFLSPDPSYAKSPGDPSPSNLYSYVQNQPTHAKDPNGLETLFIHGTWSDPGRWKKGDDPSPFVKAVLNSWRDVQGESLNWSYGRKNNTAAARTNAAFNLFGIFKELANAGKPINVVAHSHGGNVLFQASRLAAEYNKNLPEGGKRIVIDKAALFGTPIRDDYAPDTGVLPNLVLVSNTVDDVQVNGGYNGNGDLATWLAVLRMERGSEYGDAGRELPPGTGRTLLLGEKDAGKWGISPIDYLSAHSELLDRPDFWEQVVAPLFQGGKK